LTDYQLGPKITCTNATTNNLYTLLRKHFSNHAVPTFPYPISKNVAVTTVSKLSVCTWHHFLYCLFVLLL